MTEESKKPACSQRRFLIDFVCSDFCFQLLQPTSWTSRMCATAGALRIFSYTPPSILQLQNRTQASQLLLTIRAKGHCHVIFT